MQLDNLFNDQQILPPLWVQGYKIEGRLALHSIAHTTWEGGKAKEAKRKEKEPKLDQPRGQNEARLLVLPREHVHH